MDRASRRGAPTQHLLFLAGSVPASVAAAAVGPASTGDVGVFAGAMAATRVIQAVANAAESPESSRRARRTTSTCTGSHLLAAAPGSALPRGGARSHAPSEPKSAGRRRPTSRRCASNAPATCSKTAPSRWSPSPAAAGFSGPEILRRAFHRRWGVRPADYRERFRLAA